ncbi:unnamed protein product [Prunus armeniaca]
MQQSVSQMALQSEDKVIAKTNERQRKNKKLLNACPDRKWRSLSSVTAGLGGVRRVWMPGLASRVQKTLQGSSNDIGWLPRAPGMHGVEDGTARFLEFLAGIRNGEHTLPSSFVYLLIPRCGTYSYGNFDFPGLYGNHGPIYFVGTKKFFSKIGLARHITKIHSEASIEHNAWELKQYVEELYWGSGKSMMLLGKARKVRIIHLGSAGVTRPDRPGLDLSKQPPTVRLNKELDFILTFKLKGQI